MTITSYDALLSALADGKSSRFDWQKITGAAAYAAGRWYDFSVLNGTPVANTYSGTALNWQATNSESTFAMYTGGNVSPDKKHLVNISALGSSTTAVPGQLMLVDMQGYYPGINMNVNTAQTMVGTPTLRYTHGVRASLVSTVATGATAHSVAMSYTNSDAVAGRALPVTVSCTASAIVGHITHAGTAANNYGPYLPLASGDKGVSSVQSVTISAASGAGTAALILYKPITTIPLAVTSLASERDLVNQLPSLPEIKDNACLTWLYFTGAATVASSNFVGHTEFVWG
jgi:hypothetical protein